MLTVSILFGLPELLDTSIEARVLIFQFMALFIHRRLNLSVGSVGVFKRTVVCLNTFRQEHLGPFHQTEKQLIVDTTRLELDTHGGLRISKGSLSLFISASETSRALNWLKHHRAS